MSFSRPSRAGFSENPIGLPRLRDVSRRSWTLRTGHAADRRGAPERVLTEEHLRPAADCTGARRPRR